MRFILILFLLFSSCYAQVLSDSSVIRSIYSYNLSGSKSYENLQHLCKKIGGRLSGSKQAAEAVKWAEKTMKEAGADTVFLVPCMVPHWVRGAKERCEVSVQNKPEKLSVCALGGSVATPVAGIKAKVIEVHSFEELEALGAEKIKGHIVFFNVSFNPTYIHTGKAYGSTVKYRYAGPSIAAKYGAVATVVKSMTTARNDFPHTGSVVYDSLVPVKIPAFALSYQAAERLGELLKKDGNLSLSLFSDCKYLPDEPSFSVVGEIKGKEFPDKVIVTGGHLDSWDLGEGAHDDGAGVVQCIEVITTFKKLGISNKHTIRCIAFMNEENGTMGGKAYAEWARKENKKHIAALESDMGGFTPRSIGISAQGDTLAYYRAWEKLFRPYYITIENGGGGADIQYLEKQKVLQCSLNPDSQRYFDLHHTADDVFEQVNKRELELGSATIASFIYLLDKYGVYKP